MTSQPKRSQRTARWAATAAGGIGAIGMLAASFGAASAASGDIEISLGDQVASGSPGQEVTLTTRDVPSDLVGRTCEGSYGSTNNSSVHPNTDLVIRSGGTSVTIGDVEAAAGGTTTSSGPLTLGPTITVSVVLGPDGIASLGETLVLDCPEVSATTVATTVATTATTEVGSEVVVPSTMGTTTTTQVASGAPVPTALGVRVAPQTPTVDADRLPTTGSDDATSVVLSAAGGMVLAGLAARRLSLRREARDGAR